MTRGNIYYYKIHF